MPPSTRPDPCTGGLRMLTWDPANDLAQKIKRGTEAYNKTKRNKTQRTLHNITPPTNPVKPSPRSQMTTLGKNMVCGLVGGKTNWCRRVARKLVALTDFRSRMKRKSVWAHVQITNTIFGQQNVNELAIKQFGGKR